MGLEVEEEDANRSSLQQPFTDRQKCMTHGSRDTKQQV